MAVRLNGVARMVRTTPPAFVHDVAEAAADALTFSGTYPLTRLAIEDASLPGAAAVYGYSTLKPTSLKDSAYPAIALSLDVHNPTAAPMNASFMFALPFGGWIDCARPGGVANASATTYQQCMHACTKEVNCSSWEFETATKTCNLNSVVSPTFHKVGSYCGVRSDGGWGMTNNGQALYRSQRPQPSGNPSLGDITLQPVVPSAGAWSTSFTANDDPAVIWQTFAAKGQFYNPASGEAAHGAVSVSTVVPPGGNATLSIVFAWHFPDRDFSHEILGNRYADLWQDSAAVASELATEDRLTSVVSDINKHHGVVAHPANPTPVWLKDMLVNQWSHYHMRESSRPHAPRLLGVTSCACPRADLPRGHLQ